MNSRRTAMILDALAIMLLLVFTMLWAMRFFNFSAHPFEDAAILMRYSLHVAEGHGIVWNIGETPVDGATDFLYMLMVAGVTNIGISLPDAARGLGFVAHLASVALIYLGIRRFSHSYIIALISGVYLATGPGLVYVEAAFGTTVFAFFASLTWVLALILMDRDESHPLALGFGLSALTTGLIRPEGVFLTGFMLLSILLAKGWRKSQKTLLYFIAIFLVIGGGYFLWRWDYFGYPLPNPFYKKGGGELHTGMFKVALLNILGISYPFFFVFLLGLRSKEALWRTVSLVLPIIGFAGLWMLLSDEMNYRSRFQYAALPILLLAYPLVLKGLAQEWSLVDKFNSLTMRSRLTLILFALIMTAYIGRGQNMGYARFNPRPDGRYDVAMVLRDYRDEGYTMAVTEAGLLPLYSEWTAIDMWGLNDQWIAHNGEITQPYLEEHQPDLVMFAGDFLPIVPADIISPSPWNSMLAVVRPYVDEYDYCLVSAFREFPHGAHHYYIKSEIATKHPDLVTRIRAVHYFGGYYSILGKREIDYARFAPNACDEASATAF